MPSDHHRLADRSLCVTCRRARTMVAGASLREVSGATIATAAVVAALVATLSFSALTSPPGAWAPATAEGSPATAAASHSDALIAFEYLSMIALFSSLAALALLLTLHSLQHLFLYQQFRRTRELDLINVLSAGQGHAGQLAKDAQPKLEYLANVLLPLDSASSRELAAELQSMKLFEATRSAKVLKYALGLLLVSILAIMGAGILGSFIVFADNRRFARGCAGCAAGFVIIGLLLGACIGADFTAGLKNQTSRWKRYLESHSAGLPVATIPDDAKHIAVQIPCNPATTYTSFLKMHYGICRPCLYVKIPAKVQLCGAMPAQAVSTHYFGKGSHTLIFVISAAS